MDWGGRIGTRFEIWRALGRDGFTRPSSDELRQLELCGYMWWGRHLVVTTGFLIGLFQDGWERAQWLSGAMLVSQILAHLSVTRWPRRAGLVAVLDAGVFLLLSALGLSPVLVLLIGVAVLGWAATFRPLPAIGSYLEVLGAAGLMVHHQRELDPIPVLVAYCLLGGIFMLRMIRLNIAARLSSEREDLAEERVDAIFWEEITSGGGMKVSPAAQRMLGYPISRWTEPGFWPSLIHPEDRKFAAFDEANTRGPLLFRVRHQDGNWQWMENRVSSVFDRQGRHAFFVGVLLDRTGQARAERAALLFGELVAQSPIGHLLAWRQPEGWKIGEMNPACATVLGSSTTEVGSSLTDHPILGPEALAEILGEGEDTGNRAGVRLTGADGRIYHVVGRHLDQGTCAVDFLDITERVEHDRVLYNQARTDDLTGLPNRRSLMEELGVALEDDSRTTALLMLDLDDFKEINDSLGHSTGDDILRYVSHRLREAAPDGAVVARLGGDEFAVIVTGADPQEIPGLATRIAELVNQPVNLEDLRLRVRASTGIAVYPHDCDSVDELVRCADIAMYRAKTHGREPLRYDPSIDLYGTERLTLLGDLDNAITQGDLLLHHQPLFDVPTGRMMGTEALVRWQHPRLGLIPPLRFVELAEVSGQVKRLTRWVIRQALAEISALGPDWGEIDVSVNLSVRNLYEADLVSWLSSTLRELGVSGDRLIVEITESMIMVDYPAAADMIEQLRAIGIRTWIDDFGMGYSSLARLRQLPVDGVKIDRSFVVGVPDSPRDQRILRSLVELTGSLGLHSLAEGVEHAECLTVLRELGCSAAQGHLLSPPVPVQELRLMQLPDLQSRNECSARTPHPPVPAQREVVPLPRVPPSEK